MQADSDDAARVDTARIDSAASATALYATARLRALERRALATLPPGTLMQRAGSAAAQWIARRWPLARRVLVICGPGNNGGDGYRCAIALRALGRHVDCLALAPAATDDARRAAADWQQLGESVHEPGTAEQALATAELVVDAMFGIGLTRALDGPAAHCAKHLREQRAAATGRGAPPVVALDVPSGLDADRGAWIGGTAGVCADATITFLGAKPGLFTGDGVEAAGTVVVDTLGVSFDPALDLALDPALDAAADAALNDPHHFASLCRPRPRNSHKGRFGDVQVIGGARGMVGAALIAARAALRLGAGRVYLQLPEAVIDCDPHTPELMFRAAPDLARAVAVIGCGLGDSAAARTLLATTLASAAPCVIDADALNLIATDPIARAKLQAATSLRVLTPHPLEAARLTGGSVHAVQQDRVSTARALARETHAWVVLKGAGSVIAAPTGRCWINPTGSPALATAGSGDALAGMIGALLAQGYNVQPALLGAVWLHGRAADAYGQDVGLMASEIATGAARAWAALQRLPR